MVVNVDPNIRKPSIRYLPLKTLSVKKLVMVRANKKIPKSHKREKSIICEVDGFLIQVLSMILFFK